MVKLGDVCDILNGFAFKSEQYVEEGIRIIRIANVQKGFIEDSTPVFYPYDSKDAQKYRLEEGDMLMSLTGNVGRVAKLSKEFLPAALNQRVACLRIKDGISLDKAFLFNLLNSDYFEQQCIAESKGVAQKNMSTEWLKEYEIPMFPMEQQKAIASVLDKVTELIALRKEQLAKLDQLVKSRFIELFGEPMDNPKGWDRVNISTVVGGKVSNGFFAKRDDYCDDGNVKVLGVAHVVNRMYSNIENLPKTNGTETDVVKYGVKYGDMLFCRSSLVAAGIGKASIVPKGTPNNVLFECHVIRLPLDLEKCVPEFMQVLSTTDDFRNQIISQSKTATMTTIGQDGILKTDIILPPLELQKQFAAFVEQTDKSKLAIQQSLDKLELLKKSLMQEYFG